jgi:poly-gamma-glutamate synthesis protein (capsule biosynthesis protein)
MGLILYLSAFFLLLDYIGLSLLDKNLQTDISYHLAEPADTKFYQDAYSFPIKKIDLSREKVLAGVIPHHLLAADLLAEYYSNLEGVEYDTIILVGPNHFNAGQSKVISSLKDWQTPFGILKSDNGLLKKLLEKNRKINIEENIFIKEHSIMNEVGFIKKTFPEAKFIPLVLRFSLAPAEAEKLAEDLFALAPEKKILLLASVDFSHYKNSQTASAHDQESIAAISNFQYDDIYKLDIDSPASIYTLTKYSQLAGAEFKLLNNSNSAILSSQPELTSTTSYVTGYFIKKEKAVQLPNTEIKMLFFGDIMLDRQVGNQINKKGFEYLFQNLKDKKFFEGYNLVGANLEGAVTDKGAHYSPEMAYDFAFNPEVVKRLKEYNFNYLTISNNHLADQGERGIIETRKNLDELKFNYSGCQDREIGDCSSKILEINGRKIGLAGFSMVYGLFDENKATEVIKKLKSSSDLVVVNIHWGVEYKHEFNKTQQAVAYSLADAGADIIIGHHPHVVQGLEVYNNKPIFYSLGNFIFDQYFSADTQEGLAVGITIINDKKEYYLYPIKSKQSQPSLMEGVDKEAFLKKISSWSKADENFKDQISVGKLTIN